MSLRINMTKTNIYQKEGGPDTASNTGAFAGDLVSRGTPTTLFGIGPYVQFALEEDCR